MGLSPDALRLLGKVYRRTGVIQLAIVAQSCRGGFSDALPATFADELVTEGFLTGGEGGWKRTRKPYTERMRMRLARLAQRKPEMVADRLLVEPQTDLPEKTAEWFGYPTKQTRQIGRVHLMEDD